MPDQDTTRLDAQRLEARLSRLRDGLESVDSELEQLNQLATLGTAAGMIAHEVRGLMTPVRAYAQLALKAPDDETLVDKALKTAERGATSAVQISETILEIVGGITGAAPELPEHESPTGERSTNVRTAVSAALELMQPVLEESGVEASAEVGAGVVAAMGAVELQQVLVNLIENAVRAMPDGGRLTIRSSCSTWNTAEDARRQVVIDVEDSGPGVDREIADAVFQPFVSGSAMGTRSGTGLGLAVCRALVAHVRGRIGIGAAPGGGARVRITLPAAMNA